MRVVPKSGWIAVDTHVNLPEVRVSNGTPATRSTRGFLRCLKENKGVHP